MAIASVIHYQRFRDIRGADEVYAVYPLSVYTRITSAVFDSIPVYISLHNTAWAGFSVEGAFRWR